MTILAIGIALLTGLSLLLGWYFRRLETGAIEAGPIWSRLHANLNRFVMDDEVPDSVARDVTVFASITGCGCMAGAMILNVIRRELFGNERVTTHADLKNLTPAQKQLLSLILKDMVRIDFARSPFLSQLAKLTLKSALRESDKERVQVKNIRSFMSAGHHAAERQIRHHKVSKPIMELCEAA